MAYAKKLHNLIEEDTVDVLLYEGSGAAEEIKLLQNILYELGFAKNLQWHIHGADGIFAQNTRKAVKAFILKNRLTGDGRQVTRLLAAQIISRYEIIDDLRCLYSYIEQAKVEVRLFMGSSYHVGVAALQTLLHEQGFGSLMAWDKYGADGDYGKATARAVRAFAGEHELECDKGRWVDTAIAKKIVAGVGRFFGSEWRSIDDIGRQLRIDDLICREKMESERVRVYVGGASGRTGRFTRFKKGVYSYGRQKVGDYITHNKSELLGAGLSHSALNVVLALSENAGRLDAVNTWGNGFLDFGMLQWSVGADTEKSELAALLKKIKQADPQVYEDYYGRYGLEFADTGPVYGVLTLAGRRLCEPVAKEQLRNPVWAFRFWQSGQDSLVQQVQIRQTIARLDRFYWRLSIQGNMLSELVTSEYGVCLLLDHHSQRPSYVKPCLEKAYEQCDLPVPGEWTSNDELQYLEKYLQIRANHGRTPMTNAIHRAKLAGKYLERGVISDERFTFRVNAP